MALPGVRQLAAIFMVIQLVSAQPIDGKTTVRRFGNVTDSTLPVRRFGNVTESTLPGVRHYTDGKKWSADPYEWLAMLAESYGPNDETSGTRSIHWGPFAPAYPVLSDYPREGPTNGKISQVNVLQRYGATSPVKSVRENIEDVITLLQYYVKSYSPETAFIKDYKYPFAGAGYVDGILNTFGTKQMVDAGAKFYDRYHDLASTNAPSVVTDKNEPSQMSAHFFLKGGMDKCADDPNCRLDAGQREQWWKPFFIDDMRNGDGYKCENYFRGVHDHDNDFLTGAADRLNAAMPGAKLNPEAARELMALCPLETLDTMHTSPFCSLFTDEEWTSFEYLETVNQWYGQRTQKWISSAIISRLSNDQIHLDKRSQNTPTPIHIDFLTTFAMMSAFSTMGIFHDTIKAPDMEHVEDLHSMAGFSASKVVPFGSQAVIERWNFDDQIDYKVRLVLNDRVMPMNCSPDEYGMCTLNNFIDMVERRGQEYNPGDFGTGWPDLVKCNNHGNGNEDNNGRWTHY